MRKFRVLRAVSLMMAYLLSFGAMAFENYTSFALSEFAKISSRPSSALLMVCQDLNQPDIKELTILQNSTTSKNQATIFLMSVSCST